MNDIVRTRYGRLPGQRSSKPNAEGAPKAEATPKAEGVLSADGIAQVEDRYTKFRGDPTLQRDLSNTVKTEPQILSGLNDILGNLAGLSSNGEGVKVVSVREMYANLVHDCEGLVGTFRNYAPLVSPSSFSDVRFEALFGSVNIEDQERLDRYISVKNSPGQVFVNSSLKKLVDIYRKAENILPPGRDLEFLKHKGLAALESLHYLSTENTPELAISALAVVCSSVASVIKEVDTKVNGTAPKTTSPANYTKIAFGIVSQIFLEARQEAVAIVGEDTQGQVDSAGFTYLIIEGLKAVVEAASGTKGLDSLKGKDLKDDKALEYPLTGIVEKARWIEQSQKLGSLLIYHIIYDVYCGASLSFPKDMTRGATGINTRTIYDAIHSDLRGYEVPPEGPFSKNMKLNWIQTFGFANCLAFFDQFKRRVSDAGKFQLPSWGGDLRKELDKPVEDWSQIVSNLMEPEALAEARLIGSPILFTGSKDAIAALTLFETLQEGPARGDKRHDWFTSAYGGFPAEAEHYRKAVDAVRGGTNLQDALLGLCPSPNEHMFKRLETERVRCESDPFTVQENLIGGLVYLESTRDAALRRQLRVLESVSSGGSNPIVASLAKPLSEIFS